MEKIAAALEALQQQLQARSDIRIKTWEIGPPADEAAIDAFQQSMGWTNLPDSFRNVYRVANGIQIDWDQEEGRGGGNLQLEALDGITSYNVHFDWPQPMGEREHFFILDFWQPEQQYGFYLPPDEDQSFSIWHWYFKHDLGDPLEIGLDEYILGVLEHYCESAWRNILLEPEYIYDEMGKEPNDGDYDEELDEFINGPENPYEPWPFVDLNEWLHFLNDEME